MPKSADSPVRAASDRLAHRCVSSIDLSTSACDSPYAGHSSKAMAMSTPIRCWMSIDVSGDRKCAEPSMWLRNSTPFLAHLADRREREDLKAAGVGEHGAVPGHEAMHAAELLEQIDARPQHQVIGVVEDDLRAELPSAGPSSAT